MSAITVTIITPAGERFAGVGDFGDDAAEHALFAAGERGHHRPTHAAVFVEGADSVSRDVQRRLFAAGVASLTIGAPPRPLAFHPTTGARDFLREPSNDRRFFPVEVAS